MMKLGPFDGSSSWTALLCAVAETRRWQDCWLGLQAKIDAPRPRALVYCAAYLDLGTGTQTG